MKDRVKVRFNNKWVFAQLLNISRSNEKALVRKINGEEVLVEPSDIKRYIPTNEDEQSEQAVQDIFAEIKDVLNHIMPNEIKNLNLDLQNKQITGYFGGISLGSAVIEVETIGSFREFLGWEVNKTKIIHATYHEPECVDLITIKQCRTKHEAVCVFVKEICNQYLNDYYENQANIAFEKTLQQLPETF